MSKSNHKVLCIICALFLLLIGAPFFTAETMPDTRSITDTREVGNMNVYGGHIPEQKLLFIGARMGTYGLINPVEVLTLVKNQNNYRLFYPFFIAFYLPGIFLILNKLFLPMERYTLYNYIETFLMELKIIHRADGKCRMTISSV